MNWFDNSATLAAAAFYIYLCFLAGSAFVRRLRIGDIPASWRAAFSLLAGYGTFAFIGLVLALVGLLRQEILWFGVVLLLFFLRADIARHARALGALRQRLRSGEALRLVPRTATQFLWLVVGVWVALNLLITLVPITGHDTLDYHLPIMEGVARTGSLSFSAADPITIPVFGEVSYAVPMVLFGETSAPFTFQVLQYGMLVVFLLLIDGFARTRLAHPLLRPLTFIGVLAIMDLQREVLHGGYVDIPAFVFALASTLLIIDQVQRRQRDEGSLALSAGFLAVALGIKYTALFFAAFNGLALIVLLARSEKPHSGFAASAHTRAPQVARTIGSYAALVIVIAGVWYLKNTVLFGNPVYPMFSDAQFVSEIRYFMMDRTLVNAFVFPFARYSQWFFQDRETSSRLVVLGYLILWSALLVSFAVIKKLRQRFSAGDTLLAVFIALYFLFLFYTSHQYRFLLPAPMLLPLAIALLADKVASEARQRWGTRIIAAASRTLATGAVLVAVFLFAANLHYFAVKFRYLTGGLTRDAYILEIGGQ